MITFRHIVVLLSCALALTLSLVLSSLITDIETPSNIQVTTPVAVTRPVFEKPTNLIRFRESGQLPIRTTVISTILPVTEHDSLNSSFLILADHNLEQMYAVMWQELEFENTEDPGFQTFLLATLEKHGDLAPGEILAVLIQSATTTELKVDALRLLAEACQELTIAPFSQTTDDPDIATHQLALEFFDELSANVILDAVTDVLQNGDQRERLAAFTTLEEMHQFAPIWEAAYSVLDDPDPRIRMRAMEMLTYGDRQLAADQLALALSDPNPDISELAEKLLTGLEEAPS